MSTVDNPIGLSIEENKAFHEKAWSHVVGIVNLKEQIDENKRERWEGIGTGGAYRWRDKRIVLTAKHVLEDAGVSDVAFLPRTGSSLGWEHPGKISGISARVGGIVQEIVGCPWEDLAALILNDEAASRLNVDFCELPRRFSSDTTVSTDGSVLIIGFPMDQAFEVSRARTPGRTTVSLGCPCESFWAKIVREPERTLDSSYHPEHHLLIRFEPASQGLRPHGYSGATVWCDRQSTGGVWTAEPLLLGIQTHAYVKSGLVRAVRASAIKRFLEESLQL
jgi:hypothetical protein